MRFDKMGLLVLISVAMPLGAVDAKKRERDDIENAGDPQDKMICKRYTEIGSLVSKKKECRTRREWDRVAQDIRQQTLNHSFCGNPNGCE